VSPVLANWPLVVVGQEPRILISEILILGSIQTIFRTSGNACIKEKRFQNVTPVGKMKTSGKKV
jgi:hypothetical protein